MLEDEDIASEECGVCQAVLKACKKLGDKLFCKTQIDKVKKNQITAKEFSESIKNKFGEEKFQEALEQTIQK